MLVLSPREPKAEPGGERTSGNRRLLFPALGSALLPLVVLLEPLQAPLVWVRAISTSSRWKGRVARVWNGKEGRGAGGVIWAETEDAATNPRLILLAAWAGLSEQDGSCQMLNQDNNLSARSSEQAWLLVQLPAQLGPCACQNTPVTSRRIHKTGESCPKRTTRHPATSPGLSWEAQQPQSKQAGLQAQSPACPPCLLPEPRQLPGLQGWQSLRSLSQPAGNPSLLPSEG